MDDFDLLNENFDDIFDATFGENEDALLENEDNGDGEENEFSPDIPEPTVETDDSWIKTAEDGEERRGSYFSAHNPMDMDDTEGYDEYEQSKKDGEVNTAFFDEEDFLFNPNKDNKIIVEKEMENDDVAAITLVLDSILYSFESLTEEVENKYAVKREKVRTYNGEAKKAEVKFAKPKEERSFISKLIIAAIICAAIGIFFGVQANSYFNYENGKVTSDFACMFSWLMATNMPISVSPLNTSVFMTAFFTMFGVSAVVTLLVWLSMDDKKRSRVGHEHGAARLGTTSDFKQYKNKFME